MFCHVPEIVFAKYKDDTIGNLITSSMRLNTAPKENPILRIELMNYLSPMQKTSLLNDQAEGTESTVRTSLDCFVTSVTCPTRGGWRSSSISACSGEPSSFEGGSQSHT